MVSITREGNYYNHRNKAIYDDLAKSGYNPSFFKKPSEQTKAVDDPFHTKSVKKDCFSTVVDSMSYVPTFFLMRKR